MKLQRNLSFRGVDSLFEDIESKYAIVIDDLTRRKMMLDICNLIRREVFLLDELETYIIRCKYGIYQSAIGSSEEDISQALGYSVSTVLVIFNKAMKKIYEFLCKNYKIREYGSESIYSLEKMDYDVLCWLEKNKIIFIDDLLGLEGDVAYQLFRNFRMKLMPMFDESVVSDQSIRDYICYYESIHEFKEKEDISNRKVLMFRK